MASQEVYAERFKKYTPSDLHDMIAASFIKSEALIEEIWVSNRMQQVIEFHGDKLQREISRQIIFLDTFLNTVQRRQAQKKLR